jgi:Family of unknown function (DUF5681)
VSACCRIRDGQLADGSNSGPPNGNGYKVGYKRPPREHCFRPGQSGNPTGKRKDRAATTETVKDLILREVHRLMQVRVGDKVISLPARQPSLIQGRGATAEPLWDQQVLKPMEKRYRSWGWHWHLRQPLEFRVSEGVSAIRSSSESMSP